MASDIDEATLDVCIERLTRRHPRAQLFIFKGTGDPFWARYAPEPFELTQLSTALRTIERALESRPAPLTGQDVGKRFSFLVLDADATWFAVVFGGAASTPAEARDMRRASGGRLPVPEAFEPR
jgi:hypothetical protein